MNAPTDMLGNSKGRGESVDGTSRVSQDGKFSHPQIITHNGNIIWSCVS